VTSLNDVYDPISEELLVASGQLIEDDIAKRIEAFSIRKP
jgi:DNA-directed RNA polymerase subunit beta'